jgi:hypothetical protein
VERLDFHLLHQSFHQPPRLALSPIPTRASRFFYLVYRPERIPAAQLSWMRYTLAVQLSRPKAHSLAAGTSGGTAVLVLQRGQPYTTFSRPGCQRLLRQTHLDLRDSYGSLGNSSSRSPLVQQRCQLSLGLSSIDRHLLPPALLPA